MNEASFAPKNEAKESQENVRLRHETAKEDGMCEWCKKEYKKGDRIAMYKREEPNVSDEKYKPYHVDCLEDELDGPPEVWVEQDKQE